MEAPAELRAIDACWLLTPRGAAKTRQTISPRLEDATIVFDRDSSCNGPTGDFGDARGSPVRALRISGRSCRPVPIKIAWLLRPWRGATMTTVSLTWSCFAKARTARSRRSSALIRASCGRRLEAVPTSAKRGTPSSPTRSRARRSTPFEFAHSGPHRSRGVSPRTRPTQRRGAHSAVLGRLSTPLSRASPGGARATRFR